VAVDGPSDVGVFVRRNACRLRGFGMSVSIFRTASRSAWSVSIPAIVRGLSRSRRCDADLEKRRERGFIAKIPELRLPRGADRPRFASVPDGLLRCDAMVKNWQAALSRVRDALRRRGRTVHDAEDLVQEAWVRLACYSRERTVAEPEAFLMRAALNLSIDAYRLNSSRGEEVVLDEAVLIDTSPGVEAVALARERMTRLISCLGRLNTKTRDIFLAHRVDGMSYQEIARQHRLSVSAVEKHIARATLAITSWMEGW
jgi:RNA polymerase sigma factor (sigma-70 family)